MRSQFAVCALAAMLIICVGAAASAQENLVVNGGFENGLDGWLWEQWLKKPVPGALKKADKTDGAEGTAYFEMGLPGAQASRWLAKEIPIKDRGRDHVFAFRLKLDYVPENAARVRLAIPNRGFLNGDDLVRAGGTQDWKSFKFAVPGAALGDAARVTIFFYDDQMGSGNIGVGAVSLKAGALAPGEAAGAEASPVKEVTLTGDTSRPDLSTFAYGQRVELTFAVDNLHASGTPVTLELTIVDEHGKKIETKEIPVPADAKGRWQTRLEAPSRRSGFYRVYARLSDGVQLHALGSRPAGFLTYAVVPDPARRADYGELGSHFGMQGGPWEGDACALIGARWVLDDSLFWRRTEPDHAGQFGPEQIRQYVSTANPGSSAERLYALSTLFVAPTWAVVPETLAYETGKLTPAGEKAWTAYCKTAARAYTAKYPQRKEHIYQITWEPIQPWGFKGTNADLVRIYQIAYQALHEADPRAVVAGPCRGIYNNGDPQDTVSLFKLGLGKYLDAYICHPYYSITPEQDGMPQAIRGMKEVLRTWTHRDLPMFGSEQGWPTDEDTSKEVLQAQALLRQNLITLGEGFRFNVAFFMYDYRMAGSKTGYGYYYNLDSAVPFGPRRIAPKPITPAYAAQSLLIDGCKSDGAIEWLGDRIWGYAFERPGYRVLAVWNYGKEPREVSIPTGVKQVHVFDWMGNERIANTVAGNIKLTLGPEPTYISGVSPGLWGSTAAKALTLDRNALRAFPGGSVSVRGAVLLPAAKPSWSTLLLETDRRWGALPLARQVSVGAGRRGPFRFDVHVPAALPAGTYHARLLLRDAAGSTVAAAAITVEVAAPLSMRLAPLFGAGDQPGVAVTLQDRRGEATAGQLNFTVKAILPGAQRSDAPLIDLVRDPAKTRDVPDTRRRAPIAVPAGGNRHLVFMLPGAMLSPSRRYEALVTITAADGFRFAQTAAIEFLPARHLRRPIAVDGDLSDWASVPAVALTGPGDVIRSPQYYPKDKGLSARIQFAWDKQALYVAAEVKDNVFSQVFTGGDIWRGDSLQLAFNLDPWIPDSAPNAADRRTSEITVALTKSGPEAYRHLSFAPGRLPLGPLSSRQFHLAIRRVGEGGLIYEMTIPWTSLGLAAGEPWQKGDAIGVAAAINEVRSADQTDPCALGLFGGITPNKDPDQFGTLILEK